MEHIFDRVAPGTALREAIDKIHSQKVEVTTKNSQITVDYHAQKASSLFLTLPYDKGWSATQNGHPVTIYKAQDGFMKVDVKKGSGRVILKFIPRGFKEGIGCFIFGIALFTLYNYKKR